MRVGDEEVDDSHRGGGRRDNAWLVVGAPRWGWGACVGVRGRAWARTVVPWRERARRARADVCEARGVEQEGGSHTNGRGAALVSTGLTNRFMEKRMETRLL